MKEKCKIFFDKTSYLWEGVFSLLFVIFFYLLLTTKNLEGHFLKGYFIVTVFIAIILVAIMVYNFKKSKKQIEKIFLTFIIPIGIFYMIFMLPTYAPDESSHIWRAYEISQGNILTKQDDKGNELGVNIPNILIEAKQETLNSYNKLDEILAKPADYENTTNVISTAQAYPFFLYLPAVIVFLIVRICNISIMYGIYIAKLCNFIVFVLGGYYAIKKIPFGKYILMVSMFLPIVLQQAVSLSADSIINTVLFIYIAYTISLVFQKEKITRKQQVLYSLLIVFVALAKMAYIPLIGVGFLLIFTKNMTKKEKITILGIGTVICIALVAINYVYTSDLKNPSAEVYYEQANVNGIEQIKFILKNPIGFLHVLKNTFLIQGPNYMYQAIGSQLGWLDINVSQTIITAFMFILIFSAMIECNKNSFSAKQRVYVLLVGIATILLIIVAMYITWTTVGLPYTNGVQGRYFIPVIPLLLLCISMKENYIRFPKIEIIIPIILTVLNGVVLNTIFNFFNII